MSPSSLAKVISMAIRNRRPLLIKGAPGIGKSDIVVQACNEAGAKLIIEHPVVSDPTDFKGLPFPSADGQSAHFLPFGSLLEILKYDDETKEKEREVIVYFIDDLGQAPPAVQAAAMQLILARRINGFRVSDKVVFIAATNRKADKAGVTGILEPVKSRFASIIELEVSVDDWISWAIDNKMPSELLAFIRFRGEKMLHDFHPTADIQNSPSPRTVANVGYLMRDGIPNELRFEIFSGAAGEGWAGEFMGFLKLYENLPTIESIIKDPDNAPIFSEPSLNFAVTSSLASKANAQNFDTIMKYGKRMPKEFQVLLVKDSVKHNRKVSDTKAFMDWALANSGVIL